MNSKEYIIFSIYLAAISFNFLTLALILNLKNMFIVFFILFIVGILMIISWSYKPYIWVCGECGMEFKLSFAQTIINFQGGVDYQKLFCPYCKKINYCTGINKR